VAISDPRGVPLAAGEAASALRLEAAILDMLGFRGDPVGKADAALAHDPDDRVPDLCVPLRQVVECRLAEDPLLVGEREASHVRPASSDGKSDQPRARNRSHPANRGERAWGARGA
jgi:hypothetical protein